MSEAQERNHAADNARAWLESIHEMVTALRQTRKSEREAAELRIHEAPLSVEVRGEWHTPGAKQEGPAEYLILLSTGGPTLRIVGELSQYCEPETAWLEYQDWFTPWTEYGRAAGEKCDENDDAALLAFAQQFYFAEG